MAGSEKGSWLGARLLLGLAMVGLAGAAVGLMAWYYSPKRVEERWLRAEEQWLRNHIEWTDRQNKWLEEHRTPALEEWIARAEGEWDAEWERQGRPRFTGEVAGKRYAARWNYQGTDEQVREWLKRDKEHMEQMGEFNRRYPIWLKKGGDGDRFTLWIKERLRQQAER